ncbi:MAG: serine/threonine protein phosphatase [Verrucomicrobiaceae bacterium]|nr:MAG: serine/threonine protein phosphatase [Verrucomicrobiaceae bacterium]
MLLTYAMGDIHGSEELLLMMLRLISEHSRGRRHQIITLGDYCDRGPHSKGVFDILRARRDIKKLRGNHEEMLLTAYRNPMDYTAQQHFVGNGGDKTLASYEVARAADLPDDLIEWLINETHFYHEDDLRVFVHAGVSWREPDMTKQRQDVMQWIREGFLDHHQPFFKHIVHGHTPQWSGKPHPEKPELRTNRTNLDTAAYYTGILTCGVFDDTVAEPLEILTVDIRYP